MTVKEFLKKYRLDIDEMKQRLLCVNDQHNLIHGKVGSGKTFLFLARVAYLIKDEQALPDEILNLVYNGDAAKRMAKMYRDTFYDDEKMPFFIEFHSFCYQIIRFYDKQYEKESWKAYRDMEKAVRKLVKDMFAVELQSQDLKRLMHTVSYCKNMMLTEPEIIDMKFDQIDFYAFYKAYDKLKKARNIYDQDDILVETARILKEHPEILELYQNRYKFIHVDEAQELSLLAHHIIKLLVCDTTVLFALADKDQCIDLDHCAYPKALDSFVDTYGNAQVGELKENYRNNKTIVQTANAFMFQKEVIQTKSEEECKIKFKGFSDVHKLYEYALRKVHEGEEELAFLYRDFAMAMPLIDILQSNQIPFVLQGNVNNFLQEMIVRDICNFLELLIDPKDMQAFYEIHPKIGLDISNKVLLEVSNRLRVDDSVDIYQALIESSYKSAGKKKLSSNMENIRMASRKNTIGMVEDIFDKFDYGKRLFKAGIAMNHPHIIAMKILATHYPDPVQFLNRLKVLGDFQGDLEARVVVRSIAASKGMEFDKVCMLDCMASIFPKPNCTKEELEEERHLFYVGITRAKHALEIFTAKRCFTTRLDISPFVYEIHQTTSETPAVIATQPKVLKVASIRRGVTITHATLGIGSVLKVSEGMMQVRFASETKTLNVKLCIKNNLIELV